MLRSKHLWIAWAITVVVVLALISVAVIVTHGIDTGSSQSSIAHKIDTGSSQSGDTGSSQINIPSIGEFADNTTLTNVSFILDYQVVNGSSILATLTEVHYECNWPAGGDNSHAVQAQAIMSVDTSGGVTLSADMGEGDGYGQLIDGPISFVGSYQNGTFMLTTSSIVVSNASGPVTFNFTGYAPNTALQQIETAYDQPCQPN